MKYSQESTNTIEIAVVTDNTLVISDKGPGMDPVEVERIFEPFYRTDQSRNRATGGYGLGLYLAKKIMLKQQGQIKVSSEVGKGTQVSLQFKDYHG